MFYICLKVATFLVLFATPQLNVGCSSTRTPDLGVVVALIAADIIGCVILFSAANFASVFLREICVGLRESSNLSLPCVRLLALNFWQHTMLLKLKADNSTGSF